MTTEEARYVIAHRSEYPDHVFHLALEIVEHA